MNNDLPPGDDAEPLRPPPAARPFALGRPSKLFLLTAAMTLNDAYGRAVCRKWKFHGWWPTWTRGSRSVRPR